MGGYITFLFFWNHFLGVLFCLVFLFFLNMEARDGISVASATLGTTFPLLSPGSFPRNDDKPLKTNNAASDRAKSNPNATGEKWNILLDFLSIFDKIKKKKRIIIIKTKQIKTVKLKQHLDSRYHQIVWWGIGWERSPTGQSQSFLWKTKRNGHKPNKSWW